MPIANERLTVSIRDRDYVVDMMPDGILVDGVRVDVQDLKWDDRCGISFRRDGQMMHAIFEQSPEGFLTLDGREFAVQIETDRERLLKQYLGIGSELHHHAEIRASMPGLILRVTVEIGGAITKGQAVLILEAMKMENEIRAPIDGTVREIRFRQGQTVEKGDLLMVLE